MTGSAQGLARRSLRRSHVGAAACALAMPPALWAQPAARPVRIAWLSFTRADNPLRQLEPAVNLRAARNLNLSIPQSLLLRANQVIE